MALIIPCKARCVQYSAVFVPATPNDGLFSQALVLHFLREIWTIPSGACCAKYSATFVPANPNDGSLQQSWVLHYLLLTSTILSGACYAQHSAFFKPSVTNAEILPPQPSALYFVLREKFNIPSLACISQHCQEHYYSEIKNERLFLRTRMRL